LNHVGVTNECDKQTDGRTDGRTDRSPVAIARSNVRAKTSDQWRKDLAEEFSGVSRDILRRSADARIGKLQRFGNSVRIR